MNFSENQSFLNTLLTNVADAIVTINTKGIICSFNPAAEKMFGYLEKDILNQSVTTLMPEKFKASHQQFVKQAINQQYSDIVGGGKRELIGQTFNGKQFPIEITLTHFIQDKEIYFVGIIKDLSFNRQTMLTINNTFRELLQFRKAMDESSDCIFLIDHKTFIFTEVNSSASKLLGYSKTELLQMTPDVINANADKKALCDIYHQLISRQKKHHERTTIYISKTGTKFNVIERLSVLEQDEQNYLIIALATDVTEQKKIEEQLIYASNYDELTGLPNRKLLKDRIQHAINQAQRKEQLLAIMFLDLDRFKNINDTLGHHIGDEVLIQAAKRIKSRVREGDTVARLGGDEFVIVLEGIRHVDEAAIVADNITEIIRDPIELKNNTIYTRASIGITIYPFDDTDLNQLLKNADAAMYKAKEKGRDNYQFYSAEISSESIERINLEHDLRDALTNNEFEIFYQPQLNLSNQEIVGAEALLRWKHKDKGMISPVVFIPILEDSGMILQVGEWVIRHVCEQIKQWQAKGIDITVAVNISARQLLLNNFDKQVKHLLKIYQLDAHKLEIELTESTLVEDVDMAAQSMKLLSEMGIPISVDDFGTGYSSLSYLKKFPLTTLKIDRSFVIDIVENQDSARIAKAIIALAKAINLKVIAEGVETKEQLQFLIENDCDEAQGYFFSPPVNAKAFEEWMATYQPSKP